jgi:hypothetical protein
MSLKRILALLVTAALLAGCGSDRDKGKNRNKDLPEPPAKEKPKG